MTGGAGPSEPPATASRERRPGFAATLVLTATLAIACFLLVMSLALLVIYPSNSQLGALARVVNQQNQDAKTALYLFAFGVILPLSLLFVPRLADAVARRHGPDAFSAFAGALSATLAAMIIALRASHRLPWGDGLGVVLAGVAAWCAAAGFLLARIWWGRGRGRAGPLLVRLSGSTDAVWTVSAVLLFATLLCVTKLSSLRPLPLVLGSLAALATVLGYTRIRIPRPARPLGLVIDVALIVLLLLAIPDTVIFRTSSGIPNPFFPPGVIQFQHDWILGPTNQLLGGGALLVNAPVSQYGVGLVYFLAGWFKLVPIGHGTFGFLDGLLTALFYVAGYAVLRLAGASRLLAGTALAIAVATLIYNLAYPVGALPEQGPLRFGLPMLVVLALVAAGRLPDRARLLRAGALAVLGISSIWALEGFAYTAATFAALSALEASLRAPGTRLRFLRDQAALGIGACVCAHVIFAAATLAATGQLPDWGQYFAYLHALLLGGIEGSITYGFDHWSPGLAVGAFDLTSAVAIVLLVRRAPAVARPEAPTVLAIGGLTAYSIAVFSYIDNRSSTYLLLYIALPVVLASALWLRLLMRFPGGVSVRVRQGGLALCLAIVVVLVAAAWPSIGGRFSSSALAHAYPGGGLSAALHRLWHPPPIDPRAPEGVRLLTRYVPGKHPLVLLPTPEDQDLAVEILMRSRRSNRLFIGWGNMDSFVPSVWMPVIGRQLHKLRPGERVLMDRTALAIVAALRADPTFDPINGLLTRVLAHHKINPNDPLFAGVSQEEWILREISRRFDFRPVYEDREGFVVAQLAPRAR